MRVANDAEGRRDGSLKLTRVPARVPDREVTGPAIDVVNEAVDVASGVQRLLQRVEHEVRAPRTARWRSTRRQRGGCRPRPNRALGRSLVASEGATQAWSSRGLSRSRLCQK